MQSPSSAQTPETPNNPSTTAPSGGGERPVQTAMVDGLLRAAAPALVKNVKEFSALVPRPHRILEPHSETPEAQEHYGKTVECFQDGDWCRQLIDLGAALSRYFLACRTLKFEVDKDARENMVGLAIASLEVRQMIFLNFYVYGNCKPRTRRYFMYLYSLLFSMLFFVETKHDGEM